MPAAPSDEQKAVYRQAFVRNCFILLTNGYARLKSHDLRNAEEPHITGEIVRCIREVLEDEKAEPWMRDFDIHDDPPQNVPTKFGKQRPRVDIEFIRVLRGPRPRLHIEAKRLYRSGSINEYYGDEGLGMFVAGTYAAGEPSAAMIGYVQTKNSVDWLGRLTKGFKRRVTHLSVCEMLRPAGDYQDIGAIHVSGHQRASAALGRIDIYHLLLEFL